MNRSKTLPIVVVVFLMNCLSPSHAIAQRTYIGSTPIEERDPFYVSNYGNGQGFSYITPPRTTYYDSVYPSRIVQNGATRGTVIEYTHNGNGYISSPGSSYQTVISSGPSIFPYTTVVQPSQPPVIIQTRPTAIESKTFAGRSPTRLSETNRVKGQSEIQLVCPKESRQPLAYLLNGTTYTIKPGYLQTFPDDRQWTIAFLRSGNNSEIMRYDLTAGTYRFVADENGWDLKQYPSPATKMELPPSPAPAELPLDGLPPTPAPTPAPSPGL